MGEDLIAVTCPHCQAVLMLPKSLKGGMGSCVECNKAFPIPGGLEPAFWILIGFLCLVVLAIAGAVLASGHPVAAAIVLAVGWGLIGLMTLAL